MSHSLPQAPAASGTVNGSGRAPHNGVEGRMNLVRIEEDFERSQVEDTQPTGDVEADRRTLLDLLLEEEGAIPPEEETIPRRPYRDRAPLSFAQELLWLLDQLMPGSTAYNVRWVMRIGGALDVAALRQTLGTIVARHEVLRTTYHSVNGEPVQVIAPAAPIPLEEVDLRPLPVEDRDAEVARAFRETAQRPFDLARDVFGGRLLRTGDEEHVLILALHHIMCDGWSRRVFFRELASLYGASCIGLPSPLSPLPIQYADYGVWQRERMRGELLDKLLAYWRRQLAGAPALLELPTDRPRPAVRGSNGARQTRLLPRHLADTLHALSQAEGATLFMTLLAAFQVLLHRYSGQSDIVVGSPIASRNRVETEGLIGLFANVLALRAKLSVGMTFRDLLRQVRETCLAAYEHQELPFEKLVVELQPERNLSYTPVFQVMFILQNMPPDVRQLADLTVTTLEVASEATKFDLTLAITEAADGLHTVLAYNTDLFDDGSITWMMGHLETLLKGIAANPDESVRQLPLLTEAERQLFLDWNNTAAPCSPGQTIHRLIEAQAARTPKAAAVVGKGQTLTYEELDARSNQLARYLVQLGVRRGMLVGVCMERSPTAITALLGILKAGAAYVALDPAYPRDRLAFMVADTAAPVLLTSSDVRAQLPETAAEVICLDTDWPNIAGEPAAPRADDCTGDDTAYVVYTSGSTGKPKGVVVTHASLVNAYLGWEEAYQLRQPNQAHLQMASMSFDVFTGDLVRALCSGAKLVLCPMEVFLDPKQLYELMRREKVTCAEFVPAVLRGLMQYLERTDQSLDFMRLVIAGSDTWYVGEYREIRRRCGPGVRVINSYGVAEATIDSTFFEGSVEDLSDANVVPIGRPFPNTEIYILDTALRPAPMGVPGELHLGGPGLARGYLNQPELTATKFIPHPLHDQPGSRLYRTGDRARYRPDGNIEFLGRADQQVKVRGIRMELGEIQTVLARHQAVREAVVVVREDTPGDPRLVAYVVPAPTAQGLEQELLRFLREQLPAAMVPNAAVLIERIPLTPNGKVDRGALPAPAIVATKGEGTSKARDAVEMQLTLIWEEVLGRPNIGAGDNFFDIGGHSLLAAQVVTKVKEVFGRSLPLRALFQAPTIAGLAELLRQEGPRTWPTLIPIRTTGSRTPLFCVVRPNANPLGYTFLARHLPADQPLYVLQSPFRVEGDQAYTQSEFAGLAAEYLKEIRGVQSQGRYCLVGFCEGALIAFEMARQLEEQGQKIGLLGILDAWPVENTRSYYRFRMHQYLKRLGALLGLNRQQKPRLELRTVANHVGRLLVPVGATNGAGLAGGKAESYRQRYWPGKTFTPPTIQGKITVFRVRSQPYWRLRDTQLGWGKWTAAGVESIVVPGRHGTILREPHVGALAEELIRCLAEAAD
jgi:amino acid adenylation domain-containing protein